MSLKFSKEEIIEAILSGSDHAVLCELYKEIYPLVELYVRKNSGLQEDGKDVFQEAMLVFYNCVLQKKTDRIYDVNGFIIRVSKNIWINRFKKEKKFEPLSKSAFEEKSPSHLSSILDNERLEIFYFFFNRLDKKSKQALTYAYFEKLSMREIARIMNFKNEQCAKTFCYRSRLKLFSIISDCKGKDLLME